MGAYDFIQKPIDPTRLKTVLANAARQRETERELEVTRRKLRDTGFLGSLVGSSKKMLEMFAMIERVAPSNVSVLITGESGTGKELVARTLHELSPRRSKPFCRRQLRRHPGDLDRKRDLWPREGFVYRGDGAPSGVLRAGRGRHAVAR